MTQPFWPLWVARHFARHTGPEDEPDPSVNGDPSSTLGEEPDEGEFDEMSPLVGWDDPEFEGDDEDDEDC